MRRKGTRSQLFTGGLRMELSRDPQWDSARLSECDSDSSKRTRAESLVKALSPREREVAIAVGEGKANADIAAELYMSVPTVKAHVSRIMVKLDATNRVQIAIRMHDADLI